MSRLIRWFGSWSRASLVLGMAVVATAAAPVALADAHGSGPGPDEPVPHDPSAGPWAWTLADWVWWSIDVEVPAVVSSASLDELADETADAVLDHLGRYHVRLPPEELEALAVEVTRLLAEDVAERSAEEGRPLSETDVEVLWAALAERVSDLLHESRVVTAGAPSVDGGTVDDGAVAEPATPDDPAVEARPAGPSRVTRGPGEDVAPSPGSPAPTPDTRPSSEGDGRAPAPDPPADRPAGPATRDGVVGAASGTLASAPGGTVDRLVRVGAEPLTLPVGLLLLLGAVLAVLRRPRGDARLGPRRGRRFV